jgi:hypothetical protein
LLVVGRGFAQPSPEPEPTRLEFKAPEGCGSAEEFAARVGKRSSRIKLAPDAGKRSLVVEIQPADAAGLLRGRVTLVEPDGATRARQLKASSCEEALDGLSLIATVTLDPEALMGEPAPPPEAPPSKPAEAPKPQSPKRPQPLPIRAERVEPYRLSFGVGGAVLLHIAPEPTFGGQIAAMFELSPGHVLSPAWRLSLVHAQLRGLERGAGEANFAYTLPTLEVCPVRLGPRVLGFRPCASATVGFLKAWGMELPERETHVRFFGAAGVSLLALARVSKTFEIIADARAGLAVKRDEFAIDRVPFFTTPALGFSSALGVAGGFP